MSGTYYHTTIDRVLYDLIMSLFAILKSVLYVWVWIKYIEMKW